LVVYDIVGRKIRTLGDALEPAGFRHIAWDGANEAGARVPSGTYLVHIQAGPYKMARKITLMK
jgi:flagellar hook assembly protein FlgD